MNEKNGATVSTILLVFLFSFVSSSALFHFFVSPISSISWFVNFCGFAPHHTPSIPWLVAELASLLVPLHISHEKFKTFNFCTFSQHPQHFKDDNFGNFYLKVWNVLELIIFLKICAFINWATHYGMRGVKKSRKEQQIAQIKILGQITFFSNSVMTNVSRLWFRYRYTKCRSVKNLCDRDIKIEKLSLALKQCA